MKLKLPEVPTGPRIPAAWGALVGVCAGLALGALAATGAFDAFDARLYDARFKLRGEQPAPDAIAIVEVDDATVRGYDRWPLPRESYALLLESLTSAGAQAVAFDLTFIGRSEQAPDQDQLLVDVTRAHRETVHAIGVLPRTTNYGGELEEPAIADPDLIRHGRPISEQSVVHAAHASLPFPELLAASDALGHTALSVDDDGVVRAVPWFVRYGDWAYPALALRATETGARDDARLPHYELARDGLWMHRGGTTKRVPADATGATRIVYQGGERAFAHRASMLQVLQWAAAEGTAALASFARGRIILVGATAQGEATSDIGATPFTNLTPLVYVHANALAAALQGRFLWSVPRWLLVLWLAVVGALLGMGFARLGLAAATGAALTAVVLLGGADFVLFVARDVDLPATALLALPLLTWSAVEGLRRQGTERAAIARAKELEVARAIQRRFLPAGPPRFAACEVHGLNEPADAVGGDYFDWLVLKSGSLAITVADVTGHGIPAALQMTHLRACLHATAAGEESPASIVTAMNRMLVSATEPGRFATFFLGVLSADGRRLRCCNAGHNPPLLVRAGNVRELGANGIPLAMMDGIPWDETEVATEPGDVLVLYSDGVTECPHGNDMYGEERWRESVLRHVAAGVSANEITARLLADLSAYAHGDLASDDVTIVVLKVAG